MPKTTKWGLVSRRVRWGLTFKGWFGIFIVVVLVLWLFIARIEPFLAYSLPVEAEILVVEGWIGDASIVGAMAEFERKPYELLITTGTKLGRGEYLSEYQDFAHLSEATLITLGFDPQKVQPIPTPPARRDRTLTSAFEVKKWLRENEISLTGINIYSDNVHARRSWLTYRKVFEPEVKVGIISHPALDYDSQTWWSSSEGFKKVTSEVISYLYTRFL